MPTVQITQSAVLYAEQNPRVRVSQVVVLYGEKNPRVRIAQSAILYGEFTGSTTTTTTTSPPWYVEDVVITYGTTTTTITVPGSTTTSTTTTSTTSTTSTTTSTTTTTTIPPHGLEWGEEEPYDNVYAYGWTEWQTEDGDNVITSPRAGDLKDWGRMLIYPGTSNVSSVKSLPSGWKTLTVEKNRYGTCSGFVNVYIRGSSTEFDWDASSPTWTLYTVPVYTDWNYSQLKVEYGTTTTTTV